MDFHALQKKLFEMDPSDPKEDLKKLQEQAKISKEISPTINYLEESVKVNEGSLPLPGLDLDSFAKLAGVQLSEKQKIGPAGQAKGSDTMPKKEPGRTKHPLKDKLVGEMNIENTTQRIQKNSQPVEKIKSSVSAPQLAKVLGIEDVGTLMRAISTVKSGQKLSLPMQRILAGAFINLMKMDPQQTQNAMLLLKRMQAESIEEKKEPEPPKQRNPVAAYAQRSGAGVHKDQNKKNTPPRKEKHKSKSLQYESIKERLWEALNRNK